MTKRPATAIPDYGCELHGRRPLGTYHVHRIIRHGTTVTIRHHPHPSPVLPQVETYPTILKAQSAALEHVARARNGQNLTIAFEAEFDLAATRASDPEQAFLEVWANATRVDLGADLLDPRRYWTVVRTHDHHASRHHGLNVIRSYVHDGPHCNNQSSNQLVDQLGRLPIMAHLIRRSEVATGLERLASIHLVAERDQDCLHGPIACASCETRMAELLEYLLRDLPLHATSWEHTTHLVATARRLIASSAKPTLEGAHS